jgi:hypothetical protein
VPRGGEQESFVLGLPLREMNLIVFRPHLDPSWLSQIAICQPKAA